MCNKMNREIMNFIPALSRLLNLSLVDILNVRFAVALNLIDIVARKQKKNLKKLQIPRNAFCN